MHQVVIYLTGIALGLGLIFPIGPINLYVMRQGLALGWRRALPSVFAIAANDSLMIGVGAVVGAAATAWLDGIQQPLMVCGAVYLTVLGVRYVRTPESSLATAAEPGASLRQRLLLTFGLVWLNPHALMDVFGVLGTAIGSREPDARLAFALGVVSASWIWYAGLSLGAGALRERLTSAIALRIDRLSGGLLLAFAGMFWLDVLR